jgi:hypothetical protein
MKTILLTQGKQALVDDDDFEKVNKYNWCLSKYNHASYALRHDGKKRMLMHRLIMDCPEGKDIDHINGNGLDNRKCNLRICSRSENMMNSGLYETNTSGFRGVHWDKQQMKWRARIHKDGKKINLGRFDSKEEAARVRDAKVKELFGDFAVRTI